MKIIKKITIFFGVVFLILVLLLSTLFLLIRNIKAKDLVVNEIKKELGINVTIRDLDFSPLLTLIRARGVTIHNPSGFDEQEMAYLDYIDIVWDPMEVIMRKNPHIYIAVIDLTRLNIVKNKQGKVNIKELLPIKEKTVSAKHDTTPFCFDILVLTINEIHYTEYSGSTKKISKYKIGIKNQVFTNLKDEDQLVRLIVAKAIENTDIGKLINLTISPLTSNVFETINAAMGTAKTGARSIFEAASMPFKMLVGK